MGEARRLRLAVLVSGSGTNLQSLVDKSREGSLKADIVVVVSDNPEAYGLVRAQEAKIPTRVIDYRSREVGPVVEELLGRVDWSDLQRRERILGEPDPERRRRRLARLVRAEARLITLLDPYRPDLICLAGYMRLLSPFFVDHYNGRGDHRIVNIHPALLPSFPGVHGYEDTFASGCKWGGVTVHFVDEGEDTGPIIAQAVYPIWADDDIEALRRRGLRLEYQVYAQCINWIAAGQLEMRNDPKGRKIVTVNDPEYPRILKSWTESAFAG